MNVWAVGRRGQHGGEASRAVRIRPMRLSDVERVLPLEQLLFAGDPPWTAEVFRSELADMPGSRWYVVAETVHKPREVVGYAGLRLPAFRGDPADVYTVAVAPAWQRHRIGSRLMRVMVDEARANAAESLLLEVRADNEPARSFYTRHGFVCIGRRPGYFGGRRDALVMRRQLWMAGAELDDARGDNR